MFGHRGNADKSLILEHNFFIYRSSAGSGKTRTLAREFLLLALRFRADYFKHILAVTFTNKATQEMKDRILTYLNNFATGKKDELAEELKTTLDLDDNTFQQYAQEAQAAILHKYDRFAISTIDAFFQKVIRSFTREAGLVGDYRLEVEQDIVLEEVIDNLIDELGTNKVLTDWVVEFARVNLENERPWDVRGSLINFAQEIFKEEFKQIESEVISTTSDRGYFTSLKNTLKEERDRYIVRSSELASEALAIFQREGWTMKDVHYGKGSGIQGFLDAHADMRTFSDIKDISERLRSFLSPERWPSNTNKNPNRMIEVARERLVPILTELIRLDEEEFGRSLTADTVLQNLYVFGLVADISRKLSEYKDENNMMLLADAPKFLNGVIQDSDTPFIYEKVGSFYKNYLIDEFQDTSAMQWKNFLPLLMNSLDQGYSSMVVGDVKQAIYRWRGGDLKLLQQTIEGDIGSTRISFRELNTNYRSTVNVAGFNNEIFDKSSKIVSLETNHPIAVEAYHDVAQKTSHETKGFVDVNFYRDEPDLKWRDQAMNRIPKLLEELQESGASLKDIAILVRRNEDGQQIVAHLLNYRNSEEAKAGLSYDVVSNESLRLDGASSVNLLLAAMRYLLNADDEVARAQLSYEFAKTEKERRDLIDVFAVANKFNFEANLPPAFSREKAALKKLPLVELTETLISIFKLGENQGEIAYLLAFQNLVLEFYSRERNDLASFLEWWEDIKHKKSLQLSGEVDAVQILTIHKSKGLQFRYVIIPFCSWALDHESWQAPNLWVKSDIFPYNDAGYLPVRYGASLKKTYFAGYYEEERVRTYLDNLNLLYVAFTRAEHGMIIMAPHPDVRTAKKSVAGLLHSSIAVAYPSSPMWSEEYQSFTYGERVHLPPSRKENTTEAMQLYSYPAYTWRDKLVIRQTAKGYFDEAETGKHDKISYGIHLHTVLSRIRFLEEIPDTLERIVLEGLISVDEKDEVLKQLQDLLTNTQIASWFDSVWDVRTEIPVLLPGGAENRIDRLLIQDKKAIVIDFKTGTPIKTDQKQVQEYIDILRKMNFTEVEGYLLYIRTKDVVSVIHGKPKVSRKQKDEHQLGLDF